MAKKAASLGEQLQELRAELKEVRQTQRASIQARQRQVEDLDYTPVEIPVGMDRPPSIQEMIRTQIEGALSLQAQEEGYGSFEEEDDFEPEEEELLPLSGFEVIEMEPDDPPEEAQEAPSPEDSPQGAVAPEAPAGAVQEAPEGPKTPSEAPPDKHPGV